MLAEHEPEVSKLDLTAVFRDWIVVDVYVQRYRVAWTSSDYGRGPVSVGAPAGLLDRVRVGRVDAWPDEARFTTESRAESDTSIDFYYLLDLEPEAKDVAG